jgi:hypothetical protein
LGSEEGFRVPRKQKTQKKQEKLPSLAALLTLPLSRSVDSLLPLCLQIERITAMASKYIGRHVQAGVGGALSAASPSASASGLADPLPQAPLPSLGCSSELTSASMASDLAAVAAAAASAASAPSLPLSDAEKPLVLELAIASMDELLHLAQAGDPLWSIDPSNPSAEIIDQHLYLQRFQRGIGSGVNPETSRHTGLVIMNSSSLVETFMDVVSKAKLRSIRVHLAQSRERERERERSQEHLALISRLAVAFARSMNVIEMNASALAFEQNCWIEMFPSIVSRAQTLEVLSNGVAGSFDGAIHLVRGTLV